MCARDINRVVVGIEGGHDDVERRHLMRRVAHTERPGDDSPLLGGAVVTETVFSWPGLGRLAVESIQVGDFPVVQGVVLILSAFTILANLAADIGADIGFGI